VIYLDSSVALAHLLAEDASPPGDLFEGSLVASRLVEYEVWNRLHARRLAAQRGQDADRLLGRLDFVELTPAVLARALEPFPVAVRTLDALHLATMVFLRDRGADVGLATYDRRLAAAADAVGVPLIRM
jgi:predicted nucleic acid-binding protein